MNSRQKQNTGKQSELAAKHSKQNELILESSAR